MHAGGKEREGEGNAGGSPGPRDSAEKHAQTNTAAGENSARQLAYCK